MKIRDVEDFVKSRKREQISASTKVGEKLKERNLDVEHVKDVILKNDICAVIDQGGNVYEISFLYNKDKDLNVALRIKDSNCYIATAYPRDTERRIKHGTTRRDKVKS